MDQLAGKYQAQDYIGTPDENDWHHVTVSGKAKSFRWRNRAGVSWGLSYNNNKPTSGNDSELLQVASDCPYYKSGYTTCLVEKDRQGNVVALMGPGGERYTKLIISKNKLPKTNNSHQQYSDWSRPPLKIPSSCWGTAGNKEGRHVMLMTLASTGADWRDLAFLAAVPASATMNSGHNHPPSAVVLVPGDDTNKDDDAMADFLARYQPNELSIFSAKKGQIQTESPNSVHVRRHGMDSLHTVSMDLAKAAWPCSSQRIVIAPSADYAAALLASSVAARIQAPLFFVDGVWNKEVLAFVKQMLNNSPSSKVVLVRGKHMADDQVVACMNQLGNPTVIPVTNIADAIAWLTSQNISVEYLAVVNPNDRTAETECASRKLSLTAPVYAARRKGLVLPIDDVPVYNQLGRLDQYDQQALRVVLKGLRSAIAACRPEAPKHVAIVGGFNVMPTCQTDSKLGEGEAHAVSDIPYGQFVGDDCCGGSKSKIPFRDLPIGRIYAESLSCGSLLAARTVNYEHLVNPKWAGGIVEGGSWGFPELSSLVQMTGLCSAPQRMFQKDIDQAKVLEATAIFHKDHSCPTHLGNFINIATTALYAPAIVITRGCSAAGIDEGDEVNGTVPGRMLGRGCVAYLGAPRTATTASTLTETTYFHELLYSSTSTMSIGQALCEAYNKSVINHLDGGPMDNYCFENEVLLGDPALVPSFVGSGASKSRSASGGTCTTVATSSCNDEGIVTVTGPSKWRKTPIERSQLDEWKFKGDLFTYVAGNVEQETVWGPGYDKQELYYCVSVDLPSGTKLKKVMALDATENLGGKVQRSKSGGDWTKRWWPNGRHFEQVKKDGPTTVRWRLRLLDYDQPTGAIKAELKTARFQLVF